MVAGTASGSPTMPSATHTLRSSPRRFVRRMGLERKRSRNCSSVSESSGISSGLLPIPALGRNSSRRRTWSSCPALPASFLKPRRFSANLLADVAAKDEVAHQWAQFNRNAAAQFDGEVRDTARVIQYIRGRKRLCWTGVQADFTAPAIRPGRRIGGQGEISNDLRQEDPGPPAFGKNVGVFTVPTQSRPLRHRAIHHTPGINKEACFQFTVDFTVCILAQPERELLQLWLDDFVVDIAPGIARN